MGKNRLSSESSLYLRQHADNPVHWWPWCEEAFEAAKKEDKPVLVSIGYSSCHWCHVMAHECFEDAYIAEMMNRMFINIKVDREERPDVDQIYMESVQMLNQPGGWPLNVFCLPDKKPFTGGTYHPPEDQGNGIIPWPHLLVRIAEAYKVERESLQKNGDAIQSNLEYLSGALVEEKREWQHELLAESAENILTVLDGEYGGFGQAPKFPPAQILSFLMSVSEIEISVEVKQQIENAVRLSVHALIRGGLYDHVGGGFFRYSVDGQWRVPHFEKMLYDNALIIEMLSRAKSYLKWDAIDNVVFKSVKWLENELESQPGVYGCAIDADSSEGEGVYYLWSESQLRQSISSVDIDHFLKSFSISGSDALNLYPWSIEDSDYRSFAPVLNDLAELRQEREQPPVDSKIIVSWNSLMLRSLAVAGFVFQQKEWLERVRLGLDWLWDNALREDGSIASVIYQTEGKSTVGEGFLDDYVNFALANLQFSSVAELLEVGLSDVYLQRAVALTVKIETVFSDDSEEGEGYFFTTEEDAKLNIVRKKEWFDNAYPSGNSSLVHLFSQLSFLAPDFVQGSQFSDLRAAFVEKIRRSPNGVAFALDGIARHSVGLVQVKYGKGVDRSHLWNEIARVGSSLVYVSYDKNLPDEALQLCKGKTCGLPVGSIEALMQQWKSTVS